MSVELVLAQVFPVVGRDNHQGAGKQAEPIEIVDEPAELLVEVGNAIIVSVEHRLDFPRCELLFIVDEPPLQDRHVGGGPGPDAEVTVEACRWYVRIVGVVKIEEREEGPAFLALNPGEHVAADLGRILAVVVVGGSPGSPLGTEHALKQNPLTEGRCPEDIRDRELVILEMSKAATEAGLDAAIGGVGDEAGRGVTAGGEVLGEGRMRSIERVVDAGRKFMGPAAGHHAGVRRQSPRSRRPRLLERDSSPGQSRQIGGRIAAVAMKTQMVSSHRVEYDQKDIRTWSVLTTR